MAIALESAEREELERMLASPESIEADPFGLAKRLCDLVNAHGGASAEFPTDIHELLIRALEHRAIFGPAVPVIDGLVRERGLFPYLEMPTSDSRTTSREMHRPMDFDDRIVFHRAQADVYHRLLNGENERSAPPPALARA